MGLWEFFDKEGARGMEGATVRNSESEWLKGGVPETVKPIENTRTKAETTKLASEMKPVYEPKITNNMPSSNAWKGKAIVGVAGVGATTGTTIYLANQGLNRFDNLLNGLGPAFKRAADGAEHEAEHLLKMVPHPTMPSLPGLPGFTGGTSGVVTILVVGIGAFVMYEIVSRSF